MTLSGKTVLITRASDPLTPGIARTLVAAGASVVLVTRQKSEQTDTLLQQLNQNGQQAYVVYGSDADPLQTESLIRRTVELCGGLDAVLLLPYRVSTKAFIDQTPEDWEDVLAQNVAESLYVSQAAARQMIADGTPGRIIFVSSVVSEMPLHETSLMGTSLAALNWLAKCAALELGKCGITVNVVAPGWLQDDDPSSLLFAAPYSVGQAGRDYLARGTPLQRTGRMEEVGNVCAFLASDASSFMTGVYLPVDGGYALAKDKGNTPYPGHEPWPSYDAGFDFSHLIAE